MRSSLRPSPLYRDGPLRVLRPEEIRYGVGKCALGRILVALSDNGIVTIMIRDGTEKLLRDLRPRFPKAKLLHDEKACRAVVAKVIKYVAAPFGRFPLPLDIRGTELQQRVWHEVHKIPFGQTSSYTRIAEQIGAPKAIRAVAGACSRSLFSFAVPCHRVLHKGGASAAGRRDGRQYRWVAYEAKLKAKRLKRSG